jgi:hypothetical protein
VGIADVVFITHTELNSTRSDTHTPSEKRKRKKRRGKKEKKEKN